MSGAGGTGSSTALVSALKATTTRWAAAVVGHQSGAQLELATGKAVMSIGGWSGSDDSPTLAQFQQAVASGQIYYLIAGGGGTSGPRGGCSGVAAQVLAWVQSHYTATTVGGRTVYDPT